MLVLGAWITVLLVQSATLGNAENGRICCSAAKRLLEEIKCPSHTKNGNSTVWYHDPTVLDNNAGVCTPSKDISRKPHEDLVKLKNDIQHLPSCSLHSMVPFCGAVDGDYFTINSHCNDHICGSDELPINIPLDDVCISSELEDGGEYTKAITCPCDHMPCIRKCCPRGKILDEVHGDCIENHDVEDWSPYENSTIALGNYILLTNSFPTKCEHQHLLKIQDNFNKQSRCFSDSDLFWRNSFFFNADGSVQINKYKFTLNPEEFCGDHTLHENGEIILNNLRICLPKEITTRPGKFDIYGVLLIIGGCFLLLTVVISFYLPELRGTLYHKVTICHNIALMIASFTWGVANLLPEIPYTQCVCISLVIQLTFLASFLWMNVMCIDITLAFRQLRSVYGPPGDKGWTSFAWYSVYAWGCPAILTCLTAAMEFLPTVPTILPRPGFGCQNCGFNADTYAILLYFYGPMIFVLVFNLILFIMTLMKIRKVEKQTAILKSRSQNRKCRADFQRVILVGKMFVLMGLTWGTEVLGWWIGGPAAYWYLPDVINFFRAIFLFVIFIAKRSVLSALKQRIGSKKIDRVDSRVRRSKSSSVERREAEIERRGRILAKQITQTFRMSRDSQV